MRHTLSEQETQAIRLCHHDFKGWTRKIAADYMGVSEQRLSSILQSAKKKAPQMFPILTQRQLAVYDAMKKYGLNREGVANLLPLPIKKVDAIIAQLRRKGVSLTVPKTVRYEPHMDNQVKQRF